MQKFIASYLIQSKECRLPGIGHFKIMNKPAENDVANQIIHPPKREIIFSHEPDTEDSKLVQYIAKRKNTDFISAKNELGNWCNTLIHQMNEGTLIPFLPFGNLSKNAEGQIQLTESEQQQLLQPVSAKRVIHEKEAHTVLVGDKEENSEERKEKLQWEEKPTRAQWKLVALILLLLALLVLAFHFYQHGFNSGNQQTITPLESPKTYQTE